MLKAKFVFCQPLVQTKNICSQDMKKKKVFPTLYTVRKDRRISLYVTDDTICSKLYMTKSVVKYREGNDRKFSHMQYRRQLNVLRV